MFGFIKWVMIFSLIAIIWFGYVFWGTLPKSDQADIKKALIEAIDKGEIKQLASVVRVKIGKNIGDSVAKMLGPEKK